MNEVVIFFVFLLACANALSDYSFPDSFMFGAGSSAYQIEGAWAENGKGENIWDHAIHNNKSIIEDGTNADTADNSYYEYLGFVDDVDALVALNVSHYKFSISWSRLFPDGVATEESDGLYGLGHYEFQIKELLNNNITPIVTLYHWDLPQKLQEWGGWTNETIIDHFVDYARATFKALVLFNVKHFITFNEPKQICKSGYGDGTLAPFVKQSGVLDYQCAYIVLKAHAAVYRMYQEEFSDFEAKISIALDGSWSQPSSDSDLDKQAAERRNQFEFGLYANPIFKGDWPREVIDRVKERSAGEKLEKSRLPAFTDEEKKAIKGSVDFMALNFYDTRLVADAAEAKYETPSYEKDLRVRVSADPSWTVDAAGNTIVPSSIRSFLNYLKKNYGDPEIFITGNGIADINGTTHDGHRVNYLSEYLSNIADAIHEDKVDVLGYTYWSLLDSFEWTRGYKPHFGLYGIDLQFDNVTRVAKRSVEYYKKVIQERKVVDPQVIVTTTTTTPYIISTKSTSPTTSEPTSTITSTSEPPNPTTTEPETSTPNKANLGIVLSKTLFMVLVIKLFIIG